MTARIKDRVVTWETGCAMLTQTEAYMLWALIWGRGRTVNHDAMAEVLWPDCETMPETWGDIIKLRAHHIRKKLAGSGLLIEAVYGRGYKLEIEVIK